MKRRMLWCGLLVVLLLLLSGCWNYSELDDRAIIAGAAIDRMESGELRLTVETVSFSDGQSNNAKSELLSGVGGSVPEAIFTIMNQSQKELYWHHATLLILGQTYAREGISELLDYILKEHEMRLTLTLAVSRLETAAEVLELECHGSSIRSFGITGIIDEQNRLGQTVRTDAYQAINTKLGKEIDIVLPQIGSVRRGEKDSVDVTGCAVFSGDRLAGWLEADETRFLHILRGKLEEAEVDLITGDGPVSLRTTDWTCKPQQTGTTQTLWVGASYELLAGDSKTTDEMIRVTINDYVNHNLHLLLSRLKKMESTLFDWESDGQVSAVCRVNAQE